MSSAERVRRHRDRKKHELEVRGRAEELSRKMLAAFSGRDVLFESGRGDRAVGYAKIGVCDGA